MSPVMGSLCTGYGGLDMGTLAAIGGGRLAWVADPDPHVRVLLATRLPGVPNLGDIRKVDWSTVEPVDVITAGFPCQDISAAGGRAGIRHGNRSGLWHHVARAIGQLRPSLVLVENVAALRWNNGGLHVVLGELTEAGYDCVWTSLRACEVGTAHRRERVFLLAWSRETPLTAPLSDSNAAVCADPPNWRDGKARSGAGRGRAGRRAGSPVAWGAYEAAIRRWEAVLGRPAPHPVELGKTGRPRLAARFVEWLMGLEQGFVTGLDIPRTAQIQMLGNGVVPQQAAHAIGLLLDDLHQLTHPWHIHDRREKAVAA